MDREATKEEETGYTVSANSTLRLASDGIGEGDARDVQEWDPAEVLSERCEQLPLAEAVLEECETNVARAGEDDGAGEPDLKAVQVEPVDRVRPAEQEVVHHREERRRRKAVCAHET